MKRIITVITIVLLVSVLLISCKEAVSVIGASINEEGELILEMSDGTTQNVGIVKGDKGDKGDTGAQGLKGDKGDTGEKGDTGAQGEKGDKGDTGAQGLKGDKGDTGEKGDTGAQGLKGDKGDPADPGVIVDKVKISQTALKSTVSVLAKSTSSSSSSRSSGVIWEYDQNKKEAYIVTGNCWEYDEIEVCTYSGEIYSGELIDYDDITGICLVKIKDVQNISVATVADSDSLNVGQDVVLAANVKDYGLSVVFGTISYLDRLITSYTDPLVQVDIGVTLGSLAGGIYNYSGELTALLWFRDDNIGFAIPINRVKSVISDLRQYGYVKGRASLNVSIKTGYLTTDFTSKYGCYVVSTNAKIVSGEVIEVNDRIVSINGINIGNNDDVAAIILALSPGTVVDIVFERRITQDDSVVYKEFTTKVELVERNW